MSLIVDALWFFLPAGIANMSPILANNIPVLRRWKTPLDFGKKYKGKRIFGDNKTWRGVVFGTFTAGLVGLLQYKVVLPSVDPTLFLFAATAAMGLGALVGDAVESFFKRRRGVKPGKSWFPFDQIDYIFGGLLFAWPFTDLSLEFVLAIVLLYFGLHLAVGYIGYVLGVKKHPI